LLVIPVVVGVVLGVAVSPEAHAQFPEFGQYTPGDVDFSTRIDVADVVYLAHYIFGRGNPPEPFYLLGDYDCTGRVDFLDLIQLVDWLYRDGHMPCEWRGHYYLDTSGLTEASVMAMWYAETLEPPDEVTARFQSDLLRVRTELTAYESAPNGIFFAPPWPVSLIHVWVDSATAYAIADSSYHAWDSLNLAFGLDSLWVASWFEGRYYTFYLRFSGVKNPSVLGEAYGRLPGVRNALWGPGVGGPTNGMWPYIGPHAATYLFTQGWGDCFAGCIYRRFYYVSVTPDSVWFNGMWPDGSDGLPDWWPQACENLRRSPFSHWCN
jgi:hypothetical protein